MVPVLLWLRFEVEVQLLRGRIRAVDFTLQHPREASIRYLDFSCYTQKKKPTHGASCLP